MIISAITITKTKKKDKYKIYMWNGKCLTLSSTPDLPQGISKWSEYFGTNDSHFETGRIGNEKMINWFDLPVVVQAHIEKMIKDSS